MALSLIPAWPIVPLTDAQIADLAPGGQQAHRDLQERTRNRQQFTRAVAFADVPIGTEFMDAGATACRKTGARSGVSTWHGETLTESWEPHEIVRVRP